MAEKRIVIEDHWIEVGTDALREPPIHRARCDCGWHGRRRLDWGAACDDADRHATDPTETQRSPGASGKTNSQGEQSEQCSSTGSTVSGDAAGE